MSSAAYRAAEERLTHHVNSCQACRRRGAKAEIAKPGTHGEGLEQLLCDNARPLWVELKRAAGIPSATERVGG